MPEITPPPSEREQTDEILRIERENADRALEETGAAVDDTADAVISRARARADAVLAAARAKTDRQSGNGRPGAEAPPRSKPFRPRPRPARSGSSWRLCRRCHPPRSIRRGYSRCTDTGVGIPAASLEAVFGRSLGVVDASR